MSKLSVGVIFGGRSVEHEASIVTAHQLMEVLSRRHDVVPIYVSRELLAIKEVVRRPGLTVGVDALLDL